MEYENIPKAVKAAIDRHVEVGSGTGGFVTAVLENNLKESFVSADVKCKTALEEIVSYLYWEVPSNCWGSKEAVQKWREHRGLEGYDPDTRS